MKRIKIILTIGLFLTCFAVEAQEKEKALDGVWELKKSTRGDGEIINIPMGFFKIFDSNGNFSNMRLNQKGAFLSHKGTYEVTGTDKYVETVEIQAGSGIDKKQTSLHYTLSEDNCTLTLTGDVLLNEGNHRHKLYEVWEKVSIYEER
ncbi:DUF4488 domain-containing protein [Sphingobacterium phlebotomi]|uniref:DUF4488 domain-containing protein n=1 Tax=Sphingobacterium phlebotomi TaxID=2605433 RepID=A0A5D4GYA4_9SPHI|nr:DUF4488 domain-containing protein [Sphingobacterium phlebotomi]TYR32963.1 DUF4488 domain-containing protein [Sphingobacterium phlebotomi]